jgi:hypothetical protein|tara:strand:+ start:195 stop:593 length:399 start_codon:yes stop_codon:yes gene_type:complete
MVSNKIIYDKLIFYYDVDDMNITIYGKDWKPVEYLSDPERREKVRQHILKYDLTKRIGGKKYMTLLNENKIDINGFTNKFDVLTSLKENIEDDNKDTAIDMVNQLIEVETGTKEESDIDTMLELENEMSRGK